MFDTYFICYRDLPVLGPQFPLWEMRGILPSEALIAKQQIIPGIAKPNEPNLHVTHIAGTTEDGQKVKVVAMTEHALTDDERREIYAQAIVEMKAREHANPT